MQIFTPQSHGRFVCWILQIFWNCSFLLAFLLRVEGLGFLLARGMGDSSFPLVSRERLKVEPMVREKVKGLPLSTSAWQRSMYFDFTWIHITHCSHFQNFFWISKMVLTLETCCSSGVLQSTCALWRAFRFKLSFSPSNSVSLSKHQTAGQFCV